MMILFLSTEPKFNILTKLTQPLYPEKKLHHFPKWCLLGETTGWITTYFSLQSLPPYGRKETDIVRCILKWYRRQNPFFSPVWAIQCQEMYFESFRKGSEKYIVSILSLSWRLLFICVNILSWQKYRITQHEDRWVCLLTSAVGILQMLLPMLQKTNILLITVT